MYPYDPNLQDTIAKMLVGGSSTTGVAQAPVHTPKVNGREGANMFNMPPNSDAILLDQNNPIAWFVMTDGAGYKTVTPYDISLHKEVKPEDKFSELEGRIAKLEEAIVNVKSNTRPNESRQHNDAGGRSNAQG